MGLIDSEKLKAALQKANTGQILTLPYVMEYYPMVGDNPAWEQAMRQQERRIKRYSVTGQLMCELFVTGTKNVRIVKGIPVDAVVKSVRFNHDTDCIDFIVWHQSFDMIPSGQLIPQGEISIVEDVKGDECHRYAPE
jgi:hypothetical protein